MSDEIPNHDSRLTDSLDRLHRETDDEVEDREYEPEDDE